ncbi:hypothetical protein EVAR_33728_1 [Eumeta japonica]|uniref:Uncharacterized protein n=1 Tax=Eumeta variegata TaxID=151549 RepID=A0A4C1VTU5_EUMVA|nr:hypothetical protein EVAR_33728_1 [Eumeta japonica]
MSILHTLAPVRVGIGRDESNDKPDDLIASPSAAGRHMRVPTARDMRAMDDAWRKSSRHRMSGNRHGSVPFLCPAGGG